MPHGSGGGSLLLVPPSHLDLERGSMGDPSMGDPSIGDPSIEAPLGIHVCSLWERWASEKTVETLIQSSIVEV